MFNLKRKEEKQSVLAEGVCLDMDAFSQNENRVLTLFLKGILVYLIIMGGMGCFLSAIEVEYAWWAVHIVLFLSAIFCSMLYYNKIWENVGYFILLIFMFVTGNGLRIYINSGFYAVANDLSDVASGFFDSNAMRSYGEQVSNRRLAITIAMCYVGCVCCILMNILISRRMQYVLVVPLCIGALMMPLYLEREPGSIYVTMLLSGLLSAYAIKGNGHYQLSQKNNSYQFVQKKNRISYVYAGKALAGMMLLVFLFCFGVVHLIGLIYPKESYQDRRTVSPIKAKTMDTVENLSMLGVMGLFNFYPNTGGLTNGVLGGVSAVRLDYEPDLILEFAPYTDDRIYFKTFTGASYLPYSNRWSRQMQNGVVQSMEMVDNTILQMEEAYRSGNDKTARGRIKITNQAAAIGLYLPYYSKQVENVIYPGQTVEYIYYPRVSDQSIEIQGSKKKNEKWKKSRQEEADQEQWLEVPEENRETIARFCEQAGLQGDAETIVRQLAIYYQENIPYTYRPGLTPRGKDFINYFLMENKRGYCAHFASAATLIFRHMGIPARYVEGYAVDPEDISEEGQILSDKKYEDYYQGYAPMGKTGVVSMNATDANAHAWVEIYDQEQGWQVVEVTPAIGDEEESAASIWRRFMNFLNGGQGNNGAQTVEDTVNTVAGDTGEWVFGQTLAVFLVFVLLLIAGRRCLQQGIGWYRYCHAGINEKLIMRYQQYLRKVSRSQKELGDKINYQQQLQWLGEQKIWNMGEKEQEECIRILEQAGFSDKEITEQDFCRITEKIAGHSKRERK